MANIAEVALKCIEEVTAKCRTITLIQNRTFTVYSEEDLITSSTPLAKPCIGIMYEGIRSKRLDPQGKGSELAVAIVLIAETKHLLNLDQKTDAIKLLDQTRSAVMKEPNRSPTGHPWRFVMENPAGDVSNNLVYVQRFASDVIV